MNYYAQIKRKILALSSDPENDEEETQRNSILASIDEFFSKLDKPANFRPGDPKSAIVGVENSYNNLCASLESNGSNSKGLTVMELYSRLNYYKSVYEKIEEKRR